MVADSVFAEGRIRRLTSDSVVIGKTHIAVPSIIELDRRRLVGGGGRTAAIVGGTGMALAGFWFTSEFCKPDCKVLSLVGGTALGATLGATVGGLLGAATNPPQRVWTRIWP